VPCISPILLFCVETTGFRWNNMYWEAQLQRTSADFSLLSGCFWHLVHWCHGYNTGILNFVHRPQLIPLMISRILKRQSTSACGLSICNVLATQVVKWAVQIITVRRNQVSSYSRLVMYTQAYLQANAWVHAWVYNILSCYTVTAGRSQCQKSAMLYYILADGLNWMQYSSPVGLLNAYKAGSQHSGQLKLAKGRAKLAKRLPKYHANASSSSSHPGYTHQPGTWLSVHPRLHHFPECRA